MISYYIIFDYTVYITSMVARRGTVEMMAKRIELPGNCKSVGDKRKKESYEWIGTLRTPTPGI